MAHAFGYFLVDEVRDLLHRHLVGRLLVDDGRQSLDVVHSCLTKGFRFDLERCLEGLAVLV